jgi:hypothetical protein
MGTKERKCFKKDRISHRDKWHLEVKPLTINFLGSEIRFFSMFLWIVSKSFNLYVFCEKSRNAAVETVLQMPFKTEVYTATEIFVLFCFLYFCNPSFLVKNHLVANNSITFKLEWARSRMFLK